MNHLYDQDTDTSDVPSVIEFYPCGDTDGDTDKMYDLADGDFDINTQTEGKARQDYVSHQDLDGMKRMINEMLRNPELLYQLPVYSKGAVPSFSDASALDPKGRAHSSNVESQISSQVEFQEKNFLPTGRRCAFVTTTTQNVTLYCQECNSSSVSPTGINMQINALSLLSQLPPLPFR